MKKFIIAVQVVAGKYTVARKYNLESPKNFSVDNHRMFLSTVVIESPSIRLNITCPSLKSTYE